MTKAVIQEFWNSAVVLGTAGLGIGFGLWAIRRRFELDLPMTARGKRIRAVVVLAGWFVASLPLPPGIFTGVVQVSFLVVGLLVFCWPNILVHAMRAVGHPIGTPMDSQDELA